MTIMVYQPIDYVYISDGFDDGPDIDVNIVKRASTDMC